MTQGFFAEILLRRDLIQNADRSRGKFRTLLLTALDRYTISVRRSKKGVLTEAITNFEPLNEISDHIPDEPVAAFDYAWAASLMESALKELESQCLRDGLEVHWRIFQARVLEPILDNGVSPSLPEVCARYGVENQTKASNMIVSVKRRFQAILRRYLRQTVDSAAGVEGAFQEILDIFSKNCASY